MVYSKYQLEESCISQI